MKLKAFWRLFSEPVAMDLGTANTLLYTEKDGIIINEPSLVAFDRVKKTVLAAGSAAEGYRGRCPEHIVLLRPLQDGGIADLAMAGRMIDYFVRKALAGRSFTRPSFLISVPGRISRIEKQAVIDAAVFAGASAVSLMYESMAACIGAGLAVNAPEGHLVLVIGGGTSEVALISLGGLVHSKSIRVAGCAMTNAIVHYIHDAFHLLVSEEMAERAKIAIGSALPRPQSLTYALAGKNAVNGSLGEVVVTDAELRAALTEPIRAIEETVLSVLEQSPPELVADLTKNGLLLTGGGSLLWGLDQSLAKASGIQVIRDTEPLTTVLRGTVKVMQEPHEYRHVIISD